MTETTTDDLRRDLDAADRAGSEAVAALDGLVALLDRAIAVADDILGRRAGE